MKNSMTKWERIRAAIKGEETDRTPVALWKHYPVEDMTAEGLAAATVAFQKKYDWDLVKFTPTGTYSIMDLGAETEWKPNDMGVRTVTKCGVTKVEQWPQLPVWDATKGFIGQQNRALSLAAKELKGEVPILQTVFSPLTTARKLAGDRIFTDMRTHPELFKQGLEIITHITIQFAQEAIKAGASGVFFATQLATYRLLNAKEYQEFGETYDCQILSALQPHIDISMIHIHGEDTMYDMMFKYPVNAANIHDRITEPTLKEARKHTKMMLAGGVNEWNTLVTGPVSAIQAEVKDAIAQTGDRGILIAPGCVVPQHAPEEHLHAVRQAVEK
jgi:uroporphyrinogen decarboxylase